MKPRTLIALALFLIGMAIVLYGLGAAIMELVHLYSSALNDPMADAPRGGERAVSERMMRDVLIGAIGVPPLIVGSVMMGMGFFGLIRRLILRGESQAAAKPRSAEPMARK